MFEGCNCFSCLLFSWDYRVLRVMNASTDPSSTVMLGTSDSQIPVLSPDPTSSQCFNRSLLSFGLTSSDAVPTVIWGISLAQGQSASAFPAVEAGIIRTTKAMIVSFQTRRSTRTRTEPKTGLSD